MCTIEMDLHFLHGFLGRPSDWAFSFMEREANPEVKIFCHYEDLYSKEYLQPFFKFAKCFNDKISSTKRKKKVLIGYSMGGRLALYAINEMGHPWDAAIFISTNRGLETEEERKLRKDADERWAGRFESEAWEPLTNAWDSQINSSFRFKRSESDFNRTDLAQSLRIWSLGAQQCFTAKLSEFSIPILWMVGADDAKFTSQAETIFLRHHLSEICIMQRAGHRLPWEQPKVFKSQVDRFLSRVVEAEILTY